MRRLILFILFFGFAMILSSQTTDFSRWSLSPEIGINKFDGDINQGIKDVLPNAFVQLSYGGTLEFALTPTYGLALDGYYFPLKASNTGPAVSIFTKFYTSSLSATVNFTRLVYPNSQSKLFILGSLGAGFAGYKFNVTNGSEADQSLNGNTSYATTFPVTLALEYNFNDPLAFGLKGHYRFTNKDNLEGVPRLNYKGVTNDGIIAATVYLRYKFNTNDKKHLRNITMSEYDPNSSDSRPIVISSPSRSTKEPNINIDIYRDRISNLAKKVDSLENKLKNAEKYISNIAEQTEMQYELLSMREGLKGNKSDSALAAVKKIKPIVFDSINFKSIYFDSNEFTLDKTGMETLNEVAKRIIDSPEMKIKINGYCDDTGNAAYNARLSKLRADQVKEKLVQNYGISADRIVSVGRGKAPPPLNPKQVKPNRRCDFYFSK